MSSEPVLIMGAVNAVLALAVGFGLHLTSAQVGLINGAVAAVIALITRSQVSPVQPSQTVDLSKVGKPAILLACVLAASSMMGCASANGALQTSTVAETGIVQLVHAAVQSEAAAYTANPPVVSLTQHQRNVAVLLKINAGEAALNAALLTWAKNAGQPMPAAVVAAVAALGPILADLTPLLGTSGSAATFAADLSAILAALQAPAATVTAVPKGK